MVQQYIQNIQKIYPLLNQKQNFRMATLPQNRVSMLKRLMDTKNIVRILESHNSLTGLIIENLKLIKNISLEFDGMVVELN